MKPKRYLVFGFETTFRFTDRHGGWNDLLDTADTLEGAIEIGNDFLNKNPCHDIDLPPMVQVVDLRNGLPLSIRGGMNREVDIIRAIETLKPHVLDREDLWDLH